MGAIKSFKKFIEESIWSDLQDRSSGEVVRKEDDVNRLDLNEFYNYIKDQYKTKVEYIDLEAMGVRNEDVLGVDITENVILFYKPKRGHILLSWSRVKIPMPFFDELADRFKIENPNAMRRIITEKDGSCTNKTFVDAIEFFLGHKESMMNESIWSDIQDRSSGEITRKEDSVNLMDKDEFFEYIKSHYKVIIDCEAPGCGTYYIRFPLFVYPRTVRYILWDPFDKRVVVRTPYIEVWPDDLRSIIDREYKREDIIDRNRGHMTYIYPKEGDGGNQFFLDFIDNMLANVDKPALKKKVLNESIWSDIQDRSSGETVRKEDDVNLLDGEGLYEYIKEHYNIHPDAYIDYDDCLDTLSVSLFAYNTSTKFNEQSIYYGILDDVIYVSGNELHPEFKKILEDNYNLVKNAEEQFEDYFYNIQPKDNSKINNALFISIIDYVLEQIKNISVVPLMKKKDNVNESIWSDLQDRSAGEVTRKEDAYDIDEKDLKKGIDVCIRKFVIQSVYYDRYDKSPDAFYDCMKNRDENIVTRAQLYDRRHETYINPKDVIPSFIRNNWETGENYKVKVEETISDLEEEIRKTGFTKKPGESINDTLSKWFDDHQDEIADEYSSDIEEYAEEYYREGGSQYTDIGVEEWWDHIEFITQINIYQEHKNDMNESIWSDLQDRSSGEIVRKEDEFTEKDRKDLDTLIVSYANEVVYGRGMNTDACNLDDFCDYIETDNEIKDLNKDKVLQYVKDYWADEVCDSVDGAIEQAQSEYHQDMYESVWSDLQDRSSGDVVRKEDEMNGDDYNALKTTLKMFGREVRFFENNKNFAFTKGKIEYKNTLEDCLKYIDVLNDSGFTDVDFSKLKKYISANWEQDPMIQKIIQWTVDGKNSKEIDQEIINASKSNETWDLNECDGVPGGITPADVGGMGAAYFPGPNGEPGSGDLPSPTGVVYHQVAPYTMFLKGMKKKKKKKKFRIEDEPCAHSKNSKTYNYVDDFREYVDRTYNNIDRRK